LTLSTARVGRTAPVSDDHLHLLVAVQAMTSHTADKIVLALLVKRDSDRSVLPVIRLHKASAVVKVFLALHLNYIVTTTTPVEGDLLSNLGTLPLGLGVELPLYIHKALCDGDKDGKKYDRLSHDG